jgi:peptidoglycan hydrolase-like protein with peptidoglycan-binding domain
MAYSLSQFKAVLNGLGYKLGPNGLGGNYSDTLDPYTQAAIQEFQIQYHLPVTKVLDSATQAKARQLIRNLQHSLNLIVNAQLPINEFYGARTVQAVMLFQQQHNLPVTGVANLSVRQQLDEAVKQRLRYQVRRTACADELAQSLSVYSAVLFNQGRNSDT